MLENWVTGNLVQHALQRGSAGFDEVGIKSAHGLFLGRRGNNHTRVAVVQGVVEPKEITVSAGDSKLWLAVSL
jgi:hypothetical protein